MREEAIAFIGSSRNLDEFLRLYIKLQEYALVPAVSRRVEKVHALVKRQGSNAFGISLPYICARIREPDNLRMLRNSSEFRKFCLDNWAARSMLNVLLQLRFSLTALRAMSWKHKLEMIYQCNLESEYSDTREAQAACAMFNARTAPQRQQAPALSASL